MMARFLLFAASFLATLLSAADPVVPPLPPRPLNPIPACLSGQALDAAAADAAVRAMNDSGSLDPAQRIAGLLVLSQLATGNRAGHPFIMSAAKEAEAQGWSAESAAYLKSVATKIGESHVIDGKISVETAEQQSWNRLEILHRLLIEGRVKDFWLNHSRWQKDEFPPDQRRWLDAVLANQAAWDRPIPDRRSPERRWLETDPRPDEPRPHSDPDDPEERRLLDQARIEEHWRVVNFDSGNETPKAIRLDNSIAALRAMASPAAQFSALRMEAIRAVVVRCDPMEAHAIELQLIAYAKQNNFRSSGADPNLRHILRTCGIKDPESYNKEAHNGEVAREFDVVVPNVPPLVCDSQSPRATLLCHLVASRGWWNYGGVDCEGLIRGIPTNPVQQTWILVQRIRTKPSTDYPWAEMQQNLALIDRALAQPTHRDMVPILHETALIYLLCNLPEEHEHVKTLVDLYDQRWKAFAKACPKEFKKSVVANHPTRITSIPNAK